MPLFRTNQDIFKTNGEEIYDENHKNYNYAILPPSPMWDNSREIQIEDVDIWEVIFEGGGGNGLYAAWCPYAQFYMFRYKNEVEWYSGPQGEKILEHRLKDLNISYPRV